MRSPSPSPSVASMRTPSPSPSVSRPVKLPPRGRTCAANKKESAQKVSDLQQESKRLQQEFQASAADLLKTAFESDAMGWLTSIGRQNIF